MVDLLKELTLIPSPSGYEDEMVRFMYNAFSGFGCKVSIDRVGNVAAHFPGTKKETPRLMIFAHMDQIGFIIRQVESSGFLRVERLGGIPEKVLPGLKVLVRTDDFKWLPGVIGSKSHHVTPATEKYVAAAIDQLYIDIGLKTREEVIQKGINIGNPCVYMPSFEQLGNSIVSGTSMDDRGGCAVLIALAEALHQSPPALDVFLTATVQEEFNLRGAIISAQHFKPDIAIGIDVCLSGDTPDLAGQYATHLGGGPGISMYNFHGRGTLNGCIAHPGLAQRIIYTAAQENISLSRFSSQGIITDMAYVQLQNEGIATIDMCFPTRYTHTPVECCDIRDLDSLFRLLNVFLHQFDETFCINRFS
jgi:putative aminopeptidase